EEENNSSILFINNKSQKFNESIIYEQDSSLIYKFNLNINNISSLNSPNSLLLSNSSSSSNYIPSIINKNKNNSSNISIPIYSIKTHDDLLDEIDLSIWLLGILYALITGICSGSIALPSLYTDNTNCGPKFLPSFSLGVIL